MSEFLVRNNDRTAVSASSLNNFAITTDMPQAGQALVYTNEWSLQNVGTASDVVDLAVAYPDVDRTGATDASTEIQAAIDSLPSGGRLYIPPGYYLIGSDISVTNSVTIFGAGWSFKSVVVPNPDFKTPGVTNQNVPGDGTWFIINDTSITPITFTQAVERATLRDIAFFQVNDPPLPGWTPTVYSNYVINVNSGSQAAFFISNIHFLTVYNAINISNGQCYVEKVYGQVFNRGFLVDQIFDIGRIIDVHFWTFWTNAQNVVDYTQTNAIGIESRRVDGYFFNNIFVFGMNTGMYLTEASSGEGGPTRGFTIQTLICDFSKYCIYIDADLTVGKVSNILYNGFIFGSDIPVPGSIGVFIDNCQGVILSLDNIFLENIDGSAFEVDNPIPGTENRINISNAVFSQFGYTGAPNTPAIQVNNNVEVISISNIRPITGADYSTMLLPDTICTVGAFMPFSNTTVSDAVRAANPVVIMGYGDTGFYNPEANEVGLTCGGRPQIHVSSEDVFLGYDNITNTGGMNIQNIADDNIRTFLVNSALYSARSDAKVPGITGTGNQVFGNDTCGTISVQNYLTPPSNTVGVFTFINTRRDANYSVLLTYYNKSTAVGEVLLTDGKTDVSFVILTSGAVVTPFQIDYLVIGY